MSDALYERYKEALRRGHVAALRDQFDAALLAYGEAAELAPERALPHASLGSILLRLRRPQEALAAYGLALERAPRDEMAQAGKAEAVVALGRPVEAADVLDRLAEQQEADGKLTEAAATARRALELAESRPRRRYVQRLTGEVEEPKPAAVAPAIVAPATVAPAPAAPAPPPAARLVPSSTKRAESVAQPEPKAPPAPKPEPKAAPARPEPARPEPAKAAPPPPRPEPAPGPPPDGATLSAQAEDRLDAGDPGTARERLLAAAAAHRAAGAIDAALDACYEALGLAPADPELHLALAELYLDRGWRGPAADKILLLGRLVDFAHDGTIRERVCQLVSTRFPEDARLTALCA